MKKIQVLLFLFFLIISGVFAQIAAPSVYTVFFTDKNGTTFSTANPTAYLTQRAITRRSNQSISITSHDFPVNQNYVDAVRNLGVQILNRSRWLNAISIYSTDSALVASIDNLPFVQQVSAVKRLNKPVASKFEINEPFLQQKSLMSTNPSKAVMSSYSYGGSFNQINMLHGDVLHTFGFDGAGKVIAVIDAGFLKTNICDTFDSLRANNQILGTWDFVANDSNVYDDHYHGTYVLSIMGGNSPGQLVGTAPKARYWLLRSEDAPTENLVEEFNWVCAAEFADSVGADVINSSLGYSTFDNPAQNHTFSDLDGNTAMATRGADFAASKGMVVCNSAGNSGADPWVRILVPSDADSILTIAAVDSAQNVTAFSSRGYSFDGRIKPDVAAQGLATVGQIDPGVFVTGNGTSFSSPLITGMCASLWQALPSASAQQIIQAVKESCNHYANPDSLTGYGIPNFETAYSLVTKSHLEFPSKTVLMSMGPNPFQSYIDAMYYSSDTQNIKISIFDITGKQVYQNNFECYPRTFTRLHIEPVATLRSGIYFITIESNADRIIKKILKN